MTPCEIHQITERTTKRPRLRPRIALAGALLFALASAALPSGELLGAGLIACPLFGSWLLLKPPPRRLFRWFLKGAGLLVFITAATPFFGPGTPLTKVIGLTVYREGLLFWASIVSRGTVTVLALGAAVSAVGAGGTVTALSRLPLPKVISGLLAVSWLQLHLLREETTRRVRSVELRSFGAGRGLRRKALGGTLGAVFYRGLDRGRRLGLAMRLRGDGEPAFSRGKPLRVLDRLYIGLAALPLGVTLWTYLD